MYFVAAAQGVSLKNAFSVEGGGDDDAGTSLQRQAALVAKRSDRASGITSLYHV